MEGNGTEMGGNALQLQVLRSGKHTAVVSNIPATISEESLRQIFSPCGEIKKIVKIPARPTGKYILFLVLYFFYVNSTQVEKFPQGLCHH